MPQVIEIDPLIDPRWDSFVEGHEWAWVSHLSVWKRILESTFSHLRGHYLAMVDDKTDEIQSAMPLFLVKSWLTGNRLVSIPFTTLTDPLVSSQEDFRQFVNFAVQLARRLNCSQVCIRTHRSVNSADDDRFSKTSYYMHHYLPLDAEPDKLLKKFHRTCVRQRIARALESGLQLEIASSESDFEDFYSLYLITRNRLFLPPQPREFLKSMWQDLLVGGYSSLLLARIGGKTVAGVLLLKYRKRVSAEIAASDSSFKDISPNHFLFWEAIKMAVQERYEVFDFGQTSKNNRQLLSFKKRWATQVVDLQDHHYPRNGNDIVAEKEGTMAYKIVRAVCSRTPIGASELLGRLCYRHLG